MFWSKYKDDLNEIGMLERDFNSVGEESSLLPLAGWLPGHGYMQDSEAMMWELDEVRKELIQSRWNFTIGKGLKQWCLRCMDRKSYFGPGYIIAILLLLVIFLILVKSLDVIDFWAECTEVSNLFYEMWSVQHVTVQWKLYLCPICRAIYLQNCGSMYHIGCF